MAKQAHKHIQQHRKGKERKTQHNCTVRGTPKVVFVAVRDGGWRRSVRVGRRLCTKKDRGNMRMM